MRLRTLVLGIIAQLRGPYVVKSREGESPLSPRDVRPSKGDVPLAGGQKRDCTLSREADADRGGVGGQALGFGERNCRRTNAFQRAPVDPLHRRDADEVRRAQTAAGRCRAAGRQHVVGTGHVVSARLRAQRADEHRARAGEALRDRVGVADDVLGREPL